MDRHGTLDTAVVVYSFSFLQRRNGVSLQPATGVANVSIGEWMGLQDCIEQEDVDLSTHHSRN